MGGPPSPEQKRRRRQMARFGAILVGAASVVTVLGLVLPHQQQVDVAGLEVLIAVSAVTAVALALWGDRLPASAYMGVVVLGTALVSLGVIFNGERNGVAAGGDEMYYLWAVLFGAYFFGRLATAAQVAFVGVSYAVVLTVVQPGDVGTSRWISTVGLVAGAAIVVRLLSERIEALLDRLGAAAHTHSPTGLANRLAFEKTYAREQARAARADSGFALLVADLDQLKAINDRYGHGAGDEAICEVGRVLRRNMRASDFGARIGGDEFALLLPGMDAAGARRLSERLSHALCERDAAELPLGLSYGVAVHGEDGFELDDLMRAADEALYGAKQGSGRHPGRERRWVRTPVPHH